MSGEVPPGVGDVLGAAGASPEGVWNGRRWKVGHPTQAAKDELEKLVVAQAGAEIAALRGALDPEVYALMWGDFRRAVGAREYRTWGPGWCATLAAPGGALLFPLAMIRQHHPEATADDVRGLARDRADEYALALDQVLPPFFTTLQADPATPPGAAARLAAAFLAAQKSDPTPGTPSS